MVTQGRRDVVFDLGMVLVDWNPRHLFVRHLGVPAEEAERFLTEICTPQWHIELDRGRPFDEGVRELSQMHPQYSAWIDTYAREWPRMFAGPIESTVTALYALHRRGVTLHALSNYPAQQIRFLYERYAFMRVFHTVVISGLLRVVKPDREIFERLLESIGCETCIFVDDRAENVAAAAHAGIEAIHFTATEGPSRLAALVESLTA
jgi:2-haloacid dehalogenase